MGHVVFWGDSNPRWRGGGATSRHPAPTPSPQRLEAARGGQSSAVTGPLLRGRPSEAAAIPRRSLRAPPRGPEGRSGRRRGPVPGQPPAPGPPLGGAGGEEAARGGRKRRCEGRAERPRAGERGRGAGSGWAGPRWAPRAGPRCAAGARGRCGAA